MTKADVVLEISKKTGRSKSEVMEIVEAFMETVKESVAKKESVFLRTFGTFGPKHRAEKVGRNISRNQPIIVPAHHIPYFKPAKEFKESVK